MNYLYFNDQFITDTSFSISPFNRAFSYGDGMFESILVRNNVVCYLEDHIQRISAGLKKIDLLPPELLTNSGFPTLLLELCAKNNLAGNARIKIIVWRKAGGLVTPESNQAEYCITCAPISRPLEAKEKADISEDVKIVPSPISAYKTLNFLPYILAGIEKKRRKLDELILTDLYGNIAETTSASIFWAKNDVVYTPSIDSGCINGIMRKQIIHYCAKENIKVVEGLFKPTDLSKAELIFTSNVGGLSLIESIKGTKINTQYTLFQAIKIGLDLL